MNFGYNMYFLLFFYEMLLKKNIWMHDFVIIEKKSIFLTHNRAQETLKKNLSLLIFSTDFEVRNTNINSKNRLD